MADRYPNRPFPADDYDRGGDQHGSGGPESDPLAELARLIGQTDPFGATAPRPANPPQRAAAPRQPYQSQPPQYQPSQPAYQPPPAQQYQPPQPHYQAPYEDEEAEPQAGPLPWMQRANLHRQTSHSTPPELPFDEAADEQPSPVHPLHRYAAQPPAHQPDYQQPVDDEAEEEPDRSRYDDALYGQLESGAQDFQREPAYPDDPYAYQDGFEDEAEEAPKRRGGLITVAAVLALAVIGTGAAFAYRTYVGSPRSGEPPIIKADNSPTKIMPAPPDSSGKTPDRLPTGDGTEKIVSREETPVDVSSKTAGPRVVFPPLNQNNNPPTAASVSPSAMPPATAAPGATPLNGIMPNGEPHKIKTFSVHGDQPEGAVAPVTAAPAAAAQPSVPAKPVATTRQVQAAPRGAPPAANAPLSLSPEAAQASLPPAEPRTRMAATTPTQTAPPTDDAAPAAAGGTHFLVVSSQTSEADAQASFRALQKKHPDQLGSYAPVIKRADLGEKGVRYRAMVGPFASRDEAARFCVSYKAAGGQCFVP